MNLEEICKRKTDSTYEVDELMFVVEEYVLLRKGFKPKINLLAHVPSGHPLTNIILKQQYSMLINAANIAIEWLVQNKYKTV